MVQSGSIQKEAILDAGTIAREPVAVRGIDSSFCLWLWSFLQLIFLSPETALLEMGLD